MNEALIVKEKHQLIESIRLLEVQKKTIEEKEKAMRGELLEAMQEYGVWDIDNDDWAITRIPESTRDTVDTKRLKEEFPSIAQKMMKTSKVKENIRFRLKARK